MGLKLLSAISVYWGEFLFKGLAAEVDKVITIKKWLIGLKPKNTIVSINYLILLSPVQPVRYRDIFDAYFIQNLEFVNVWFTLVF
jgi:hypothetical protein